MTYFVFNHRISGEQMAVEAESIAEDQELLFKGTKDEFQALGFNESQIGGLKLVNGVLTFDENVKKEKEEAKKPLAMGLDILALAQNAFDGQDGYVRSGLLHYFTAFPVSFPLLDNLNIKEKSKELLIVLAKAQNEDTARFNLLEFLQSTTCNPMSQEDFNNLLVMIDSIPIELSDIKQPYKELAMSWAQTVRFKSKIITTQAAGSDKANPPPSTVEQFVKGSCPTPQNLDKRGHKCGKRAASVKG